MAGELGQRRRRMRALLGDQGASMAEFFIMAGILAGSLGLLVAPWMPLAAPWGYAVPVVFTVGFILIEFFRQAEARAGRDAERLAVRYDWFAQCFAFACAFAGAAAFVMALGAEPQPEAPEGWTPPADAIPAEIASDP
jgi:hypothetical protein